MNYINRDGYKIGFFQSGDKSKKPVVVIGSTVYYPRIFCNEIYKNLNLVFIDHRGFLKPEKENNYMLDDIVNDIEAIRIHCGFDSVYLLGHSGHGFMAMAYAQKYPENVQGIILSNLAPTNTQERQQQSIQYFENNASPERKKFFENEIAKLPLDLTNDPSNRFSHMNIRMQAHSFYDFTVEGAYLWNDVYNNLEALDYLWGTAFAEFDTLSFVKNFEKPILLLLSDYDFLVSPTNLWNPIIKGTKIELHRFKESGHNPMFEEPYEYYEFVNAFINKNEVNIEHKKQI